MNPIIVKGKRNEALVYAGAIERSCEDQILTYLNHPLFEDTTVRIMPDAHPGAGTIVGFTATMNSYAAPSLIGGDIGCGVSAYNIGAGSLPFDKLDRYIRAHIPFGVAVRNEAYPALEAVYDAMPARGELPFRDFKRGIRKLTEARGLFLPRILAGIGTLGGGNHFIELDRDEERNRWLVIHSGSRALGLVIARHHEREALRASPPDSSIKYLAGPDAQSYYADVRIAQVYAALNRSLMARLIIEGFFKEDLSRLEYIETTHNYLDFKRGMVRKGAISAEAGEPAVIPFSMAEGGIIGIGAGNPAWNYSAPHGAGRKLTRSQAKGLSMDEYRKRTRGIWSST
ncbi:MAG: RtcB family protein, partial [Spirochaetaceae bacterium]|nr:RtcB family protein [Spirochaetaceae bacterium]